MWVKKAYQSLSSNFGIPESQRNILKKTVKLELAERIQQQHEINKK